MDAIDQQFSEVTKQYQECRPLLKKGDLNEAFKAFEAMLELNYQFTRCQQLKKALEEK